MNKMIGRIAVVVMVLVVMMSIPAYADLKCAEKGCAADRVNGGSYCSFHQHRLCGTSGKDGFNSSGYTKCAYYSGCRNRVVSGGKYCDTHTCSKISDEQKEYLRSLKKINHGENKTEPVIIHNKNGSVLLFQ